MKLVQEIAKIILIFVTLGNFHGCSIPHRVTELMVKDIVWYVYRCDDVISFENVSIVNTR